MNEVNEKIIVLLLHSIYTLDGTPGHLRAPYTHISTLNVVIVATDIFLGGERKPENST